MTILLQFVVASDSSWWSMHPEHGGLRHRDLRSERLRAHRVCAALSPDLVMRSWRHVLARLATSDPRWKVIAARDGVTAVALRLRVVHASACGYQFTIARASASQTLWRRRHQKRLSWPATAPPPGGRWSQCDVDRPHPRDLRSGRGLVPIARRSRNDHTRDLDSD